MSKPALVGILNITPDSFSDGGKFDQKEAALEQAAALIKDGAAVLDVGAESTRPGACPLCADEEIDRLQIVLPELVMLCAAKDVCLSLDTYHAETAEYGIASGVDWINDVNGLQDPAMVAVVASSHVQCVVMHSVGVPADASRVIPNNEDPVSYVKNWFRQQLECLEKQGVARERIVLDPGVGFGKTPAHSLALLSRITEFSELDMPLFIGHSRKSFMQLFADIDMRDPLTLAFSAMLANQSVDYLRVHDVASHARLMAAL